MPEFNPTKKDLLNIDSLILDIRSKKNQLVARKINLQNSLSHTNAECRKVPIKSQRYKELKGTCESLKHEFNELELQIKTLNEELNYKNKLRLEVEHHVKSANAPGEDATKILTKLGQLKVKYADFAKDRTRVASLRIMANEFITEIETIIKAHG